MAVCPVLPGVQDTAARPSPATAVTLETGPGLIDGVAGTRGAERALQPVEFSDWMET